MIRGWQIYATPCCGSRYAFPRYLSMNFMAFENWTDGWRSQSLMPNESGLRWCQCGEFVKLDDLIEVGVEESTGLPEMREIPPSLLPECISTAKDDETEIKARFAYWRHLNHAYRERYKAYRDNEEGATREAWESDQLEKRSWWKRALRLPLPEYQRPPDSIFSFPSFEPSDIQIENMTLLAKRLRNIQRSDPGAHALALAELYRELGRFDEAKQQIQRVPQEQRGTTCRVIEEFIDSRDTAPVRYRI